MITAQVVEMSIIVNNSPIQDHVHPDDHTYLWNDSWFQHFKILLLPNVEGNSTLTSELANKSEQKALFNGLV